MYGPHGGDKPTHGPGNRATGTPVDTKVTVPQIRAAKGKTPLAMITAYDFTMARLLDEGEPTSSSSATPWAWSCKGRRPRCR